ncbi:MAG: HesB/IscA family protein [Burkholderiaceae bacterium]
MFQVTPAAAQQIRASAARSEAGGMALRVAARQVADGSIEYGMGFDTTHDGDQPFEVDGLTVVVAPPCQPLLEATTLDWVELEPGAFAFIFIPPAALSPEPAAAAGAGCSSGGCGSCASRAID